MSKDDDRPLRDIKGTTIEQLVKMRQELFTMTNAMGAAMKTEPVIATKMGLRMGVQQALLGIGALSVAIAVLDTVPPSRFRNVTVGAAMPTEENNSEPTEETKH